MSSTQVGSEVKGRFFWYNHGMRTKKTLVFALAAAAVLSSTLFAMSERIVSRQKMLSGSVKYSDFYLMDTDGIYTRLSEHKGKVIFLNFFATWCPPCRNEMPSMQKLYEKMKGSDFEMIAVSVDRGGSERVKDFTNKNGYSFKVLLDNDGSAAKKYSVSSIPATFIIDKRGNIVSSAIGERDWSDPSVIDQLKQLAR